MAVSFKEVTKRFGDGTVALDRLDLNFDLGEFVVLLGPSGSGKTTACRLLAGLEQPSSGRIEIEGKDVTNVPPRFRGIGMVFQNYALYSHKTVFENIAYPLRIRKVGTAEIERLVKDVAELLRIGHYLQRKPAQLSGGQAQRVAVARALVWQPDICLMDEPLSNLDALLRLHMRTELNRLHRKLDKTFVFVTHDQEEAMTLATRIAVLKDGRLVQFDEPKTIYRRPANRFVAEFMGRPAMNTIDGLVEGGVFRCGAISPARSIARTDRSQLASGRSRSRSRRPMQQKRSRSSST
jgi:sn-glycerol 3-phosphate transport system ATP-binding protein